MSPWWNEEDEVLRRGVSKRKASLVGFYASFGIFALNLAEVDGFLLFFGWLVALVGLYFWGGDYALLGALSIIPSLLPMGVAAILVWAWPVPGASVIVLAAGALPATAVWLWETRET